MHFEVRVSEIHFRIAFRVVVNFRYLTDDREWDVPSFECLFHSTSAALDTCRKR